MPTPIAAAACWILFPEIIALNHVPASGDRSSIAGCLFYDDCVIVSEAQLPLGMHNTVSMTTVILLSGYIALLYSIGHS